MSIIDTRRRVINKLSDYGAIHHLLSLPPITASEINCIGLIRNGYGYISPGSGRGVCLVAGLIAGIT